MNIKTVDIIIPVYKPDGKYIRLLEMIKKQTRPVQNIYVVNTDRAVYEAFEKKHHVPDMDGRLKISHIEPSEFDHGGTRAGAVRASSNDYFIMLTQDAVPYDEHLVEKLIGALEENDNIAAAYARQLPGPEASETEKYVRSFNYPDKPCLKTKADIEKLGIKTYFCSNVCAAYRRPVYDKLGGFTERTIFNEDMIYAAGAVKDGYAIAYVPDAKVIHSHNYTGAQQFHRNFDLAVSQAEHPEVFEGLPSEGEGMKLVKGCISHLTAIGRPWLIPGFIWNCGCRYAGFRLGKKYEALPGSMVLKFTSNPAYWSKNG